VLAQAPDEDAVVSAELDRAHMERVRRALPSLANRQPAAYTWPAEV
jgi:predicted amidohydrolase